MKKYAANSPEAMARVLVLQMIADGSFDPAEIEELEHLHIYEAIGITRKGFIQVLQEFCNDLSDDADDDGQIHLLDPDRIEIVFDAITEPRKRLLVAALALDLAKSDDEFSEPELLLFRKLMAHWHLQLEDLQSAFQA
ncbi:hypothetical protein ACTSKR_08650 [Chitinibacteraceae bacterium HSL-7]